MLILDQSSQIKLPNLETNGCCYPNVAIKSHLDHEKWEENQSLDR